MEDLKTLPPSKQDPLTETENQLKQILTKSELFLDTAQELFKLGTPINILHESGHTCQDEESKLLLDCGYEIMKRKGRRQELAKYPSLSISISYVKIISLDDLVKQLQKDLVSLKFSSWSNGQNDADQLHKMLKRDIQNWDQDLNCMWDLGWDENMFASLEKEEVVKDVERFLLNGLLDEILEEFLTC